MSSTPRTFVKSGAVEMKILGILVLLALLGSAWYLYDLARLALLGISILVP